MSQFKQKFNSVKVHYKEVRAAKDLTKGCDYPIIKLNCIQTKYGRRILVELEDCSVFLPARYNIAFSDADIAEANRSIETKQETLSLRLVSIERSSPNFVIV